MAEIETKLAIELLDVDNYATWSCRMRLLLILKGVWDAVTGDTIDEKLDRKAMAYIGLSVASHHMSMLAGCRTAKEAWQKLEAIYQAKSGARKRQLRKELSQLTMGIGEPVSKFVARAREIQNQLLAAGHEMGDQEVAWAILAGLPATYESIVTVLETSTDKDLTLDDMLPKLMSFEQRMLEKPHSAGKLYAEALMAKKWSNLPETRKCFKCGKRGHIAKNCRNKSIADYMASAIAL